MTRKPVTKQKHYGGSASIAVAPGTVGSVERGASRRGYKAFLDLIKEAKAIQYTSKDMFEGLFYQASITAAELMAIESDDPMTQSIKGKIALDLLKLQHGNELDAQQNNQITVRIVGADRGVDPITETGTTITLT